MTNDTIYVNLALEEKLTQFIREMFKLGDDVEIRPAESLIDQIGLDSIEAFEAIVTLHDAAGIDIPEDFSPLVINSVRELSGYIGRKYGDVVVDRVLNLDLSSLGDQSQEIV